MICFSAKITFFYSPRTIKVEDRGVSGDRGDYLTHIPSLNIIVLLLCYFFLIKKCILTMLINTCECF